MTGREAPVVAWSGAGLGDDEGMPHTNAQAAKAKRYVETGRVSVMFRDDETRGWGLPWMEKTTYRLQPIPGCHQPRIVTVVERFDASDARISIEYRCDCQRAKGTEQAAPMSCSHVQAVRLFRRKQTEKLNP
jgi:hypothetical protein